MEVKKKKPEEIPSGIPQDKQGAVYTINDKSFIIPKKDKAAFAAKHEPDLTTERMIAEEEKKQLAQAAQTPQETLPTTEILPVQEKNISDFGKTPVDKASFGLLGKFGAGKALISSGELRGLSSEQIKMYTDYTKMMNETGLTPEEITTNPLMRDILKLQLNDIDMQVLLSGEVKIGVFGQLIESIPLMGKLGRYVSIGELPEEKVDAMISTIDELENQIADDASFAVSNPMMAGSYIKQIKEIEKKILVLESKVKLTTMQSPILQGNPERVNEIMEKMTGIKTDIHQTKTNLGIT